MERFKRLNNFLLEMDEQSRNEEEYDLQGVPIIKRETRDLVRSRLFPPYRQNKNYLDYKIKYIIENLADNNPEFLCLKDDVMDKIEEFNPDADESCLDYYSHGIFMGICAAYELVRNQIKANKLKIKIEDVDFD